MFLNIEEVSTIKELIDDIKEKKTLLLLRFQSHGFKLFKRKKNLRKKVIKLVLFIFYGLNLSKYLKMH